MAAKVKEAVAARRGADIEKRLAGARNDREVTP
jgi:hypothetical protein